MNFTTSNKRIRNITALLLAASTIAACGGSSDSSVDDLLGDAQTSSGDAETADTVKPADEQADAPDSATDVVVEGRWDDSFDGVELFQAGDEITGVWADDGALEGVLDGATLSGVYFNSEFSCDEQRDGSNNWGTFEWVFADDGLSFEGDYQTCGVEPPIEWNGTLIEEPGSEESEATGANSQSDAVLLDSPAGAVDYGYLSWTVETARTTTTIPEGFSEAAEELGATRVAVVEVTVTNPLIDLEFIVPRGIVALQVGDERIEPLSPQSEFSLSVEASELVEFAFPISPDTDVSSADFVVQEFYRDLDRRRLPAVIGLDGQDEERAETPRDLGAGGSAVYFSDGPANCGTTNAEITEATLATDLGTAPNGAARVPLTARQSPVYDGIGRVPDGFRLVWLELTNTIASTEGCKDFQAVWTASPWFEVDGSPRDHAWCDCEYEANANLTREGEADLYLLQVPEESSEITMNFSDDRDGSTQTISIPLT